MTGAKLARKAGVDQRSLALLEYRQIEKLLRGGSSTHALRRS